MSDITKHVTSLALSQRLKALGLRQDSIFYWSCDHKNTTAHGLSRYTLQEGEESYYENWSAYLASELHSMIPWVETYFLYERWICNKNMSKYDCLQTNADTLTNTLGHMLIHLIENGLLDEQWRSEWLNQK